MSAVTDPPGVQAERTALAWRRTGLSLAIGALAGGRLLQPVTGPWVWLVAVVGALAAVGLTRAGDRRAARWATVLAAEPRRRVPGPGGWTLALCAAGTLALGVAAALVALL
jgi:putative membrane protein